MNRRSFLGWGLSVIAGAAATKIVGPFSLLEDRPKLWAITAPKLSLVGSSVDLLVVDEPDVLPEYNIEFDKKLLERFRGNIILSSFSLTREPVAPVRLEKGLLWALPPGTRWVPLVSEEAA